jgi:hypothetical protein
MLEVKRNGEKCIGKKGRRKVRLKGRKEIVGQVTYCLTGPYNMCR